MKKYIILGATGSIGRQSLDLLKKEEVIGFSFYGNVALGLEYINKYEPEVICVKDEEIKKYVLELFPDLIVYSGDLGLDKLATYRCKEDIKLLNALVGIAGLSPTYRAVEIGRDVLLANKESLVVGGFLIKREAMKTGAKIIPIDSEHSAIFQCLVGEKKEDISRLLITCSGGALRNYSLEQLEHVTKNDALRHPNWQMGAKITIDCATLVNKAFEVSEAFYLFNMPLEKIEVLIHPESLIHSMVEFKDGNIKALVSNPDMHLAISYALSYPNGRIENNNRLDFVGKQMNFMKVDEKQYPCFNLALEAIKKGNIYPCVLNAANEAAVKLFLEDKIKFTQIYEIIKNELDNIRDLEESISVETLVQLSKLTMKEILERF